MYQGDSFFSLSVGGQVGLALLSCVLAVVTLLVAWRAVRRLALVIRLAIALAAFAGFVWLSPQVYYTYYMMIFEGLPVQWVIGWPPVGEMLRKASFTGRATLSAHGQGVLFWLLVGLAIMGSGRRGQRL